MVICRPLAGRLREASILSCISTGPAPVAHLVKLVFVPHSKLVGCDHNVALKRLNDLLPQQRPLFDFTYVVAALGRWQPHLQLGTPVQQHCVWHNDQVGPVHALLLPQVADERHDLEWGMGSGEWGSSTVTAAGSGLHSESNAASP